MGLSESHQITELLRAWSAGEHAALDQIFPILQEELRQVAQRYMQRERNDHTLQPSALVNEAFLRLVELHGVQWQDRAHFSQCRRRSCVAFLLTMLLRAALKSGAGAARV